MGNETEDDVILELLFLAIKALEEHKDEKTLEHIKKELRELDFDI